MAAGPGGFGLLDMMSDQPAPPANQAVLNAIAQARAQGAPWGGPFVGNEFFEGAAQPGMSGYFDVQPGGNIIPRMGTAQQAAADAGQSLAQFSGSMFPQQAGGSIGYNVYGDEPGRPGNDRGGFFSLEQLYGLQPGGRGVPSIAASGMAGLSTNNWRLLGRGPGWIMRNGRMINTRDPAVRFGAPAGMARGWGRTAEDAMGPGDFSSLGTGAPLGAPNIWGGAAGWPGQDRYYEYDRPQGTMQG